MNLPVSPLILVLLVLIAILAIWVGVLEYRLRRLLLGKDARSLEDTITNIREGIFSLARSHKETVSRIENLDGRVKRSIQGVETLRFNAFADAGSKQSFAIGLLTEEGDGVVISSLYSRDRMSVFAKPVRGHASEHELTEEEQEVLMRAKR
ncbi:MAG: hypothetical protein A2675_00950 [Candidatus Yonathbacteria bacterium RIFCSPHIGHO2_01_FULL_51_10]|uniref:DUF4446 domain-containing protein n=1 Tax=Candidatus Yonathbacteria bacterium RIFCSPHIGHO2_01_FULL_51_10 TaxID=1802723 RepID=A0A1G2S7M4_9BACT|nr:MAG: hypothetical protein A2675_00950 [Candidatus Yonathbacteria bacterium RIFCSPHIGHO2_01_FULL_51_10]